MKRICSFLIGLTFAVLCSQARAFTHTINFGCAAGGAHQKANSQLLSQDTFIELGAFEENFTPTWANRAQWRENWHSLQRVSYITQTQFFEGQGSISSNSAPFTTGNQAWVWLFDLQGNWALYGDTSWKWPNINTNPSLLQPLNCYPNTAAISVVGTVSATNPEIVCQLITDAPPPAVSYTDWASVLLPLGARGKTTDHDLDGQNNLMEYAFGTNPASASSFSSVVKVKNYSGQNHLAAEIQKYFAVDVTYTVQWSDNLSNWYTTGLTTVENTEARIEVKDTNPLGTNAKRFMRVLVSSPN